jgi:ubiquinone/menaquinone biosynthesis C-methylase UbiE
LEVGCGQGVGAEVILDRLGAARVTAFDVDESMVELAQRRLHARPVSLSVGEIARVLRPGGLLLFEEIPRHMLDTWVFRTLTVHPRENRFEAEEFAARKS